MERLVRPQRTIAANAGPARHSAVVLVVHRVTAVTSVLLLPKDPDDGVPEPVDSPTKVRRLDLETGPGEVHLQHEGYRVRGRGGEQGRQRAHDRSDPVERLAQRGRRQHSGARHRSRADAGAVVPGRGRGSRRGHGPGALVQRLPRELAGRLARADRLAVARVGQGRALELRFSRAAGRRVSAAAERAEGSVVRDRREALSRRRRGRDLRRVERRGARRGADGHADRARSSTSFRRARSTRRRAISAAPRRSR